MTSRMLNGNAVRKLRPNLVAKPWGRSELTEPFINPGHELIGEIWFPEPSDQSMPVLVKHIFTSERLSIQVHPDDIWARANGLPGGKSECWLVTSAEPGAELGIGLRKHISLEDFWSACLDGSVVDLIDWRSVVPGDFYYIPAGTIHAIGAGLSIVEVQQNNDVTFRLYDYGRPRELHLDQAMAVSIPEQSRTLARQLSDRDCPDLLAGASAPFAVDYLAGRGGEARSVPKHSLFAPLSGSGTIGQEVWSGGECWMIGEATSLTFAAEGTALVARY